MPGYNHDTAFALMTNDQWSSATVTSEQHIGNDAYPTTGLIHEDKLFVVHSRLNRFMDPTLSPLTGHRATLQQIGTLRTPKNE